MLFVRLTVTEALVLRPPLEYWGHITESNPYPGARRQNETEMFSDDDETSPSIAAVSAPSVAFSMLALMYIKSNTLELRLWLSIFVMFSISDEGFPVTGHRPQRLEASKPSAVPLSFSRTCTHRTHSQDWSVSVCSFSI